MNMDECNSRTWAEISLGNLTHNAYEIKKSLEKSCRLMCVIKADAYGNGMTEAAVALDSSADMFAVACADEALRLRTVNKTKPILILGYSAPVLVPVLIAENITQTVFSSLYAAELDAAAKSCGGKLKAHIKVDTGMSRLGFSAQSEGRLIDSVGEIKKIVSDCRNMDFEGIFTHFASADEVDDTFTKEQFMRFNETTGLLEKSGIHFSVRHACNSAATLRFPEMHLDMVRPGLILLGVYPENTERSLNLRPVMQLRTRIAQIHTVKKGDSVSYNRRFTAERDIVAATIPIGYADGFFRCLSNKAEVIVNGKKARVLGNICMDQCIVDITGIKAAEGDIATVMGINGNEEISSEDIAAAAGTIPYEILCSVSTRVNRVFVK